MVMEVKKIRAFHPDTPWMKEMASRSGRQGGAIAGILTRLGPEVLSRLDRLSLAVVPRPDRTVAYGVLAEGTFDGPKVREALGGESSLTLIETGNLDFSVVVLKDGSVALGPRSVLDTMLANDVARGHGLDENPAILTALEDVRQEGQVWGAVDCRSLQSLFKQSPGTTDLTGLSLSSAPVQSLMSISFRGMIGDTVDIDVYGRADAEANARTLADAARGLVALGRVGAGRDQAREWLDLLDGILISQSGSSLVLRASIPAKSMESFVGQIMSSRQSAAEAQAPASVAAPEPLPADGRGAAGGIPSPAPAAPRQKTAPPKPAVPLHTIAPSSGPARSGDSPSRPAPEPQDTRTPEEGAP